MRNRLIAVLFISTCAVNALRADEEPTALKRADLEQLEGQWELKVDPKVGLNSTVRVTIKLHKSDGNAADFGRIFYDYSADGYKVSNAPVGGISFAGVKRGKTTAIVTSTMFGRQAPFKVEPTEDLSAPFEIKDDVLTLDLSKSQKAFVPKSLNKMKLEWGKTNWEKVKK